METMDLSGQDAVVVFIAGAFVVENSGLAARLAYDACRRPGRILTFVEEARTEPVEVVGLRIGARALRHGFGVGSRLVFRHPGTALSGTFDVVEIADRLVLRPVDWSPRSK